MKIKKFNKKSIEFTNKKSRVKVQVKRIDNYSKVLLEVLEQYANEINATILAYNKKSCEETMMIKGARKSSQETTNRKTHMENVEGIAAQIAERLQLNVGATKIMARNHDIGHTFFGHSGEWWISNVKEDFGIGYSVHNAVGPRELIYTNGIYDEILDRIKEFNPEIKEKELARIRKSLWLIFDGINSHNGEKTESEFIPNLSKTENDFTDELIRCFTEKGFDRTIMPATIEGCLIRLCDKISYIPSDMLDGLHEGIIDKIDGEYIPVLTALGITQAEIDECNARKNYESIARKLQIIFTKDVIKNSTKKVIRMSPEISRLMHELRNINNREIVKYAVLQEDNDIYPLAIRMLMERFATIVLESNTLENLRNINESTQFARELISRYEGTPYEDFTRYISQMSPRDYDFTENIVKKASRQAIQDEQEKARYIVLNGENFEVSDEFRIRDTRIERYIKHYQDIGLMEQYTEEEAKRDVDEEVDIQINGTSKNSSLREKIALELGAKYLTTLNDIEFLDLLKSTELITEEQLKSLTRTYKSIGRKGLESELHEHSEAKKIREEQLRETAKIDASHDDR